jgi:Septum formation
VTIVDCAEPHDNEVYAAFDAPGSDYPGSEELLGLANAGCLARFTSFVGVAFDVSDLGATFLAPTEQSWKSRHDHEVICYLFDAGGSKLRGSMRGVDR